MLESQVILDTWLKFGKTSVDEDFVNHVYNSLIYHHTIVGLIQRAELASYLQKKLLFKYFNGWKKMLDRCAEDFKQENWLIENLYKDSR